MKRSRIDTMRKGRRFPIWYLCTCCMAWIFLICAPGFVQAYEKVLGARSLFSSEYALLNTPEEAVAVWEALLAQADVPASALNKKVTVRLYVTTPGADGWQNYVTGDDGLYGTVLPPLTLADGRVIVPLVGEFYEVREIVESYSNPAIEQTLRDAEIAADMLRDNDRGCPGFPKAMHQIALVYQGFNGIPADILLGPNIIEPSVGQRVVPRVARDLMTFLNSRTDPLLQEYLREVSLSYEQAAALPDELLAVLIPNRILYHADNCMWQEYWDRNSWRQEVQDAGRKRYELHQRNVLYQKWNCENKKQFHSRKWQWLQYVKEEPFLSQSAPALTVYQELSDYPLLVAFEHYSSAGIETVVFNGPAAKAVNCDVIKALLRYLFDLHDERLLAFLHDKDVSIEQLSAWSDSVVYRCVPEDLIRYADNIYWDYYYEHFGDKNSWQVQDASRYRYLNYESLSFYGLCSLYTSLPGYLDGYVSRIGFTKVVPHEIPDYFLEYGQSNRGVDSSQLSLSLDTLHVLIRFLDNHKDPVLLHYLDLYNKTVADLISCSKKKLLKILPPWVWIRAYELIEENLSARYADNENAARVIATRMDAARKLLSSDGRKVLEAFVSVFHPEFQKKMREQVSVTSHIYQLADDEVAERFHLVRVLAADGTAAELDLYTFEDLVGRTVFMYGPFGYVRAISPLGEINDITSPNDMLEAYIQGKQFDYVPCRVEFKGVGTTQPKFHVLKVRRKEVHIRRNEVKVLSGRGTVLDQFSLPLAAFRAVVHGPNSMDQLTYQKLCEQTNGRYFGTRYQPGFPSATGLEIEEFSRVTLTAELRMRDLGAEPTNDTRARFIFSNKKKEKFAVSVRMTPVGHGNALRIEEALSEYRKDPDASFLGRMKQDPKLMTEMLERFFENWGRNQYALFASAKSWILLGEKILHNVTNSHVIDLGQTYDFFKKNVDMCGRQADLGDFLELKNGLNTNDLPESVAIMITLAGQFIYDLEREQIIEASSQMREQLLRALARGFTASDCSDWDIPGPIGLNNITYRKINKIDRRLNTDFDTHERDTLPDSVELFIHRLIDCLSPVTKHWQTVETGFSLGMEATIVERLGPYHPRSRHYWENEEVRALQYSQEILAMRSEVNQPELPGCASHPVMRALQRAIDAHSPRERFALTLVREWKNFELEYPYLARKYQDCVDYLLALNESMRFQAGYCVMRGVKLSIAEALQKLNSIRGAMFHDMVDQSDLVMESL